MHPCYSIRAERPETGSDLEGILALFAGQFGEVLDGNGEDEMGPIDPGHVIFTTKSRAVAINVVQILVAEDVSFEFTAG